MNTRLREIRKENKHTQAELAEKLGLSRNFINLVESGKEKPSDRTIRDICNLYGISELWLRTGEGEKYPRRTRELEIAEITARLVKSDDKDLKYQLHRIIEDVDNEDMESLFKIAQKWVDNIRKKGED